MEHGRKVGPSSGTPGPSEPRDLWNSRDPRDPWEPQYPGILRIPWILWDLRTSGSSGNYLYRLKFRI